MLLGLMHWNRHSYSEHRLLWYLTWSARRFVEGHRSFYVLASLPSTLGRNEMTPASRGCRPCLGVCPLQTVVHPMGDAVGVKWVCSQMMMGRT